MRHCILLPIVAFIMVVIGGLNWGLVGLLNFNLVDALLGRRSALSRLVYTLVGLSSIVLLIAAALKHHHACHQKPGGLKKFFHHQE